MQTFEVAILRKYIVNMTFQFDFGKKKVKSVAFEIMIQSVTSECGTGN